MPLYVLDFPADFPGIFESGGQFMLFQNKLTQKSLSGFAFCLRFRVNSDLLSRLAGYFLSSVMHSCAHVLLDGVKKLHVLLNLIRVVNFY